VLVLAVIPDTVHNHIGLSMANVSCAASRSCGTFASLCSALRSTSVVRVVTQGQAHSTHHMRVIVIAGSIVQRLDRVFAFTTLAAHVPGIGFASVEPRNAAPRHVWPAAQRHCRSAVKAFNVGASMFGCHGLFCIQGAIFSG
jgi:hypothetical protein